MIDLQRALDILNPIFGVNQFTIRSPELAKTTMSSPPQGVEIQFGFHHKTKPIRGIIDQHGNVWYYHQLRGVYQQDV